MKPAFLKATTFTKDFISLLFDVVMYMYDVNYVGGTGAFIREVAYGRLASWLIMRRMWRVCCTRYQGSTALRRVIISAANTKLPAAERRSQRQVFVAFQITNRWFASQVIAGCHTMATDNSSSSTDKQLRKNRLANEKSPYLLQHASNPVDW